MVRPGSRTSVPEASALAASNAAPSTTSLSFDASGNTPRRPAICGIALRYHLTRPDIAADLLPREADAVDRGVRLGPRRVHADPERGDPEHTPARRHQLAVGPARGSRVEHDDL